MSLAAQIEAVQPDIWLKLTSEVYFNNIAIFMLRASRPTAQIDKALASAGGGRNGCAGATVEVLMPTLLNPEEDAPGPICTLEQKLIVLERPVINLSAAGTGLTAEQIAVNIIQTLQLFSLGGLPTGAAKPAGAGLQSFYAGGAFYRYVDAGPGSGLVMIEVTLRATFGLTALPRAVMPLVTEDSLTVTITDEQEGGGSAIYYTTDGSFPGPGNTGQQVDGTLYGPAQVYAAPFVVPSGTTVRAAAYYPGLQGSIVDTSFIT